MQTTIILTVLALFAWFIYYAASLLKAVPPPDLQKCESCMNDFEIETMACDSDANWFCPECWEELAPVMAAEYAELVERGEIEPEE